MKKSFILFLIILSVFSSLSANPSLTEAEQKAIDDLLVFRIQVTVYPADEAILRFDTWKKENLTLTQTASFSNEVKLILDALFELEKLTFYQVIDNTNPAIIETAKQQYNILQEWMDTHPAETPNKWTYCCAAEAFSWYLSSLPLTQILSKGLLPKEYYLEALSQDPDMTYALCGLGQWQYYAPAIGGGGKKASKASFEHALKGARSPVDNFLAHLFYSQLLFEMKDKTGAARELDASEAIIPGSRRAERFRQLNAEGISWYEFARNFEDNKAKLSSPLVN